MQSSEVQLKSIYHKMTLVGSVYDFFMLLLLKLAYYGCRKYFVVQIVLYIVFWNFAFVMTLVSRFIISFIYVQAVREEAVGAVDGREKPKSTLSMPSHDGCGNQAQHPEEEVHDIFT